MIQLYLKLFWIWWLSCNIWSIYSVMVLVQCTIHMIHDDHTLIYIKVCHGLRLLFLVVKMVCNWSWIYQRVVNERIYLDQFWICAWYSECLLFDTIVYTKFAIVNLDWYCTIIQCNGSWKFVFFVHLYCNSACLLAPTESKYSYLEDFEKGCWKLHCKVFESVVSKPWLIGCCIIFICIGEIFYLTIFHWFC